MAGERRALLIATDRYADAGLTKLRAPTGDVHALAEVLGNPAIGDFDVRAPLVNRPTDEIKQEVEGFFEAARPDDLLLLYLSGHGVLGRNQRLYFATSSTKLSLLRATGVEDTFVNDVMGHSRARQVVLMLDCCHSGAFAQGLAPKASTGVDVESRFEGEGRIVLTASTALEYAFEETESHMRLSDLGAAEPGSLFTRSLAEGLWSGTADANHDGLISIDELYDYVYRRVKERSPDQTPGRIGRGYGEIIIARNPRSAVASLPAQLVALMTSAGADVRLGAVEWLSSLRASPDNERADAARRALERMTDDEDEAVAARARHVLSRRPHESQPFPVPLPGRETPPMVASPNAAVPADAAAIAAEEEDAAASAGDDPLEPDVVAGAVVTDADIVEPRTAARSVPEPVPVPATVDLSVATTTEAVGPAVRPMTARDRLKAVARENRETLVRCPVCGTMVKGKNLVAHHDRNHAEGGWEGQIQVVDPAGTFTGAGTLRDRVKNLARGHGEQLVRCPVCDEEVKGKNLVLHYDRMHGSGSVLSAPATRPTTGSNRGRAPTKQSRASQQRPVLDLISGTGGQSVLGEREYLKRIARANPDDIVTCPVCGTGVKGKNALLHYDRNHLQAP